MTDRELAGCALLPCPFCGNDGVGNDEGCFQTGKGHWEVRCGNPSCFAFDPVRSTRAEAIAAWNRRAPSSEGEVATLDERQL